MGETRYCVITREQFLSFSFIPIFHRIIRSRVVSAALLDRLACRGWSREKACRTRVPPPIPFNLFAFLFFVFFFFGASCSLSILRICPTNYLRWVARIRIRSRPRWRRWCQLSWVVAPVGIIPDLRNEKSALSTITLAKSTPFSRFSGIVRQWKRRDLYIFLFF